ncbi:MAG: hypothetical protein R6V75_05545 [Bacteroidales bacterium]
MVRKQLFLALLLIPGAVFLSSCKKEELSSKKEILALIFEASKNEDLEKNAVAVISGTDVSAHVTFATNLSLLIPTIEISPRASISPASGIVTDFSSPVTYTVTAEDGTTKVFTVTVVCDPAPFIGIWNGGPISINGIGLVDVELIMEAEGNLTLELMDVVTKDLKSTSMKGTFDPNARAACNIVLQQTHRWINDEWRPEEATRVFRYDLLISGGIRFYYCPCHPSTEWLFQIDLTKE